MYNVNSHNTAQTLTRIGLELEAMIVTFQKAIVQLNKDNVSASGRHDPDLKYDPYFSQLNNNLVRAIDDTEGAARALLGIKQLIIRNAIFAGHDSPLTTSA